MNKVIIAALALVLLVGTALLAINQIGTDTNALGPVPTSEATTLTDSTGPIVARARLVPMQNAALRFPSRELFIQNPVGEVLVKEGDNVKQGNTLAHLDDKDLQLRLQEAQAKLELAQARYEQMRAESEANKLRAEVELANLQAEAEAAKLRSQADAARLRAEAQQARLLGRIDAAANLDSSSAGMWQAAEILESTINANREKLASALTNTHLASTASLTVTQAELRQAQLALEREQATLEQAALQAPFDGTVVEVNLVPGTLPSMDAPAIVVADLSSWKIVTQDVGEFNVVRIREGDPVTINFDALSGVQVPGRVLHVNTLGKSNPGETVVTYEVTVIPDQMPEVPLHWNMTAWVTFGTSE